MPKYIYEGRKPFTLINNGEKVTLKWGDVIEFTHSKLPNKLSRDLRDYYEETRLVVIETDINEIKREIAP